MVEEAQGGKQILRQGQGEWKKDARNATDREWKPQETISC
jgi:hypothetical protein